MLLLPILAMLLLFSLSIFVHELGHFLAARALGLAADVFSIGMGPALWQRRFGATVWKIGAFPFGGYVVLPQMDPNSFLEGTSSGDRGQESGDTKDREQGTGGEGVGSSLTPDPCHLTPGRILPRVAPWRKIVVSVAGALGNLLFAFFIATVVWWTGKPASLQEQNAVIGYVAADGPAAAAGLAAGDEVLAVDGRPVATWLELAERAALAPAEAVVLRVRRQDGAERDVRLELENTGVGIRLLPGIDGMDACHVAGIAPGSGAEAAGLQPGDQVVRFDGQEVYSRAHLSQLVEAAAGRPAPIEFLRGGERRTGAVESAYNEQLARHLIGIQFNTLGDLDFAARVHLSPWTQIRSHATAIFRFLDALATPATSGAAADAVGGPVAILIMLWLMIRASFILAVWFTGFINVNLAILNLLPLPVLDGGHVVLSLYEWIFRRPVPARLVAVLVNTFAVLFLALILLLVFRDSARHLWPLISGRGP